jgi:chromosomal replication initiation ATPase DnaA
MAARQLALALSVPVSRHRADLIEDSSNAEALAWLDRPGDWPLGRFAIHGPAGVGKSHMLAAMAEARGWAMLDATALRGLPALPGSGVVLDDADCAAEEAALFHLINLCAEHGAHLLMAGRSAPARWPVALSDLASRLRATAAAGIGPPSDALLGALLAKLFADRQLRVTSDLQSWLLTRLPREAAALAEAVARLDRAALAARVPVTRGLARAVLGGWDGFAAANDGFEASAPGASPALPALL